MSFECPSSPIYGTSAEHKYKSKKGAKLYRYGTPTLRDMLREKCRIRIKEARQHTYCQNRLESPTENVFLKEILRQELAELEHDISLQDKIYNELEEEMNEWIAEQLDEEQNYLIEVAASRNLVCPLCQLSNIVIFQEENNLFNYRCKCNANFTTASNLEILREKLFQRIDEHEQNCVSKLNFFVNPLSNQLESMCDTCYYFCTI